MNQEKLANLLAIADKLEVYDLLDSLTPEQKQDYDNLETEYFKLLNKGKKV